MVVIGRAERDGLLVAEPGSDGEEASPPTLRGEGGVEALDLRGIGRADPPDAHIVGPTVDRAGGNGSAPDRCIHRRHRSPHGSEDPSVSRPSPGGRSA